MEVMELLKKYKTTKIIKLINKNKLDVSLEDLLMEAINCNKKDLVVYLLDNKNIYINYINDLNYDYLSMAVSRGNIEIIELLLKKYFDISRKYEVDNKKVSIIYFVRDLETLKYLENFMNKKEIKKDLESVISATLMNYNIELLEYILTNYKVNITRIKYKIQDKNYNMLELSEEILQSMKNREYRKRELALYISDLLSGKRYRKIEKRAYQLLEKIEKENQEIEKYYKYIKKQFGVKK